MSCATGSKRKNYLFAGSDARMRIAVNHKRGTVDEIAFVNLVALGETAEFATKYLRRGAPAIVDGRLQTRSYEKDGEPRVAVEILVNEVQLLDRKSDAISCAPSYVAPERYAGALRRIKIAEQLQNFPASDSTEPPHGLVAGAICARSKGFRGVACVWNT